MSDVRTDPKRIVDLNPKWIENGAGELYGISYDCPCGLPEFDPLVTFELCCPIGGRQVVPTKTSFGGKTVCADSIDRGWDLTGDSFENITLTPSIHQVGHWHGFLTNGVLVSC